MLSAQNRIMLKDSQDAWGHIFMDYLKKGVGFEITERDDGYFDVTEGPRLYFKKYANWGEHEKRAMKYVRGRVLDIGCGAGRHALYLQNRGLEVVGIDISPLAVEVCKLRGLRNAMVLSITQVSSKLGKFDTILMLGNNFGLFGSFRRARWLLRRFHAITTARGRIVAETRDPYKTDSPDHKAYHQWNRERGRMPGQVRLRVRYKKFVTPWFDYLMVSKREMEEILRNTGWYVSQFIDGEKGMYIAIIDKKPLI
ncbi:hypothetical protein B6U74_02330 [Candidatus Bathyarchaeota archaeon ex4484_205]|nr:MAG: hypothetical protein B6U74_02330 [Candidatus Bathyarchaeota archaeon ex4484_205]